MHNKQQEAGIKNNYKMATESCFPLHSANLMPSGPSNHQHYHMEGVGIYVKEKLSEYWSIIAD